MTPAPSPAVVSTALRPLLGGPARPARLLGHTPAAAYLEAAGGTVALVAPRSLRLPNAMVVDQRVVAMVATAGPAVFGGGRLAVGALAVAPRRWWDPRPRLARVDPDVLAARLDDVESALPGWPTGGPPLAERLRSTARALACALTEGDDAGAQAAAGGLIGLGPGLTPAGDDVVAGALAALRLLGEAAGSRETALAQPLASAARAAARRTTALSRTLLDHAARGEVAAPVAALLRALAGRGRLPDAAEGLLAVGHTSGHDLARGILAGGRAVVAHRLAEARAG